MPLINVTEKKRAANARNAQRSTGPRTETGRDRSSRNALTHGCTSNMLYRPVNGEPHDHYANTLARLMDAWNPIDDKEAQLVQAIAITWLRIERSERWESTILNSVMDTRARKTAEWLLKKGRQPNDQYDPDLGACIAMVDKHDGAEMWQQNQRHSTKAWREWQHAVDTLRKMQDKRIAQERTLVESSDMGSNCKGEHTRTKAAAAGSQTAAIADSAEPARPASSPVMKTEVTQSKAPVGSNCISTSKAAAAVTAGGTFAAGRVLFSAATYADADPHFTNANQRKIQQ